MWRIIRWPLGLLLVVSLGCFAANAFDDPLTPLAQAMLQDPVNTIPDEQNLYVMLAGLDAPAGESVLERGKKNIADFKQAIAASKPGSILPTTIGRTPEAQRSQVKFDAETMRHSDSFWDTARQRDARILELSERYQELLRRYEALHGASGYFETLRPDIQNPFFFTFQNLRRLYLADLARRIRTGNREGQSQAMQSLAADLAMWQRVLLGEGNLISKMIATGWLHEDLLLLSDVAADPAIPLDIISTSLGSWLSPVPVDMWKIGKVFAAEIRFSAGIFPVLYTAPYVDLSQPGAAPTLQARWDQLTDRLFYLPQATLNAEAEWMHKMQQLADGGPAGLQTAASDFAQTFATRKIPFPAGLRNYTGKKLLDVGNPAYVQFSLRIFDVAALQRAVVLAYQIRAQRIAPEDVPGFMKQHPQWAMHPVGPTPLEWNADSGTINVPKQASGPAGRRLAVRVIRPK